MRIPRGLTVTDEATEEMCGQVIYPAAVMKNSSHPEEAQAFLDFLQTDACMEIFEKVGFSRVGAGGIMDWYPLWNSLRIAAISCTIVFFLGIFAAYYGAKLPRAVKGVLDVVFTLPMVLPPTVCGYFLLVLLGLQRPLGKFLAQFGIQFAMTWYGGIVASTVVAFPLMYRTARGAFESFDSTLAYSGQTLGLSNTYIFWRIRMPACRQGDTGRDSACLRQGAGGIWGHQHADRVYSQKDSDYFHHGLSALENQSGGGSLSVGDDQSGHLRSNSTGGQHAGAQDQKGRRVMSLSVHIRKRVGDFQLSADLEHPGGITGILGASGCGKSLTLKAVAGIVKPDAGRIVLDGKVLYDSEKRICLKPQQREVGYLFQNYALFPNMTVEKNILCGLRREKGQAPAPGKDGRDAGMDESVRPEKAVSPIS